MHCNRKYKECVKTHGLFPWWYIRFIVLKHLQVYATNCFRVISVANFLSSLVALIRFWTLSPSRRIIVLSLWKLRGWLFSNQIMIRCENFIKQVRKEDGISWAFQAPSKAVKWENNAVANTPQLQFIFLSIDEYT